MGKKQGPRTREGDGGGRVELGGEKGASEGAESQLSAVEFRAAGAGFRVSLPGNQQIPAGGVGHRSAACLSGPHFSLN